MSESGWPGLSGWPGWRNGCGALSLARTASADGQIKVLSDLVLLFPAAAIDMQVLTDLKMETKCSKKEFDTFREK